MGVPLRKNHTGSPLDCESPGQPSRGNGQKIKQGEAEKKGKESHMTAKIPARALL